MTDHHRLNQKDNHLFRVVDEVLHYVWDPIGISGVPQARNEYDSWVPQVFGLLRAGSDAPEIADCLQRISADRMGLAKLEDRASEAAAVLVEWRDYLKERPE